MDITPAGLPVVPGGYAQTAGGTATQWARPGNSSRNAERPAPTPDGGGALSGDYGRLRVRQDGLNELALALRGEGKGVEIRKLFPPYPPEQEARMAYLDRISGLRRQIEALLTQAERDGTADGGWQEPAVVLAEDVSRQSRQMLASQPARQSISSNRLLLEEVARMDPVH